MEEKLFISRGGYLVPKAPIEKEHKHDRFNYLFKRLLKSNVSTIGKKRKLNDSNILDHIFVEIYNQQSGVIVKEFISWTKLLKKFKNNIDELEWYLELPVLTYTAKTILGDEIIANVNSLKEGFPEKICNHYIRLKYLPKEYTEHILYRLGLVNHLIYDMIVVNNDPEPKTVVGIEAYNKIERLFSGKRPTYDISYEYRGRKVSYHNKYYKLKKKTSVSLIDYLFSELCGVQVYIYPSMMKANEISWYIVSKKYL